MPSILYGISVVTEKGEQLAPPDQVGALLPISRATQAALDEKASVSDLATPAGATFSVSAGSATDGQKQFTVPTFTPGREFVILNGAILPASAYTVPTARTEASTLTLLDPLRAGDVLDFRAQLAKGVHAALADRATTTLANVDFPAARASLGLREINAADPQYAGGMVADCTGIAIGTDNGPRLQLAVNAWVAAGPGAVLRVPAGRYRIATPVDLNLNGQVGMVFDASDAIFTPDRTAFRALDFHNGIEAVIRARFVEGGPFSGWGAAQPYPVNYGVVAEAVEAGGQEAIRVSGITGYSVDLTAENYAGRLLRVARARSGEPTTGGIKGVVRTSRGNDFSKPRVGQSLFTDNGAGPFTGFWGHLDGLHNNFDAFAPIWRDINDVAISYLDGAYAYNGPSLQGVGVFKGGIIYVGDIDSNTNNIHFDISPSPATGRLSNRVSMNQLTMLNAGNGLRFDTPDPSARALDIRHLTMVGAGQVESANLSFGSAVTLINAKGVNIGAIVGEGVGDSLLAVTGSASDDIRAGLYAKGLTGNFALVAPEVAGRVQLSGRVSDPSPGRSVLVVGGNTPVRLDNFDVSSSNGASLINISSATNRVRWVSGSKAGTGQTFGANTPAYVSPAVEGVP